MLIAIIATAAMAVGAACVAFDAARREPAYRRGTLCSGVAFLLWGAISIAALAGLPDVWFWGVLRPLIPILFIVATNNPASGLPARENLAIVADGWLFLANLVGVTWIVAVQQNLVAVRPEIAPALLWFVPVMLLTSAGIGLALRTMPMFRTASLLAIASSSLSLVGDAIGLATRTELAVPFWALAWCLMAYTTRLDNGGVYGRPHLDPRPRTLRLWQLPVPLALALIVVPGATDPVVAMLLLGTSAAACIALTAQSYRTEQLWNDLTARSRLYEDLLENTQDVILQVDDFGVIEFANPASTRVLAMTSEQLVGTTLTDYLHPDDQQLTAGVAVSRRGEQRVETRFRPAFSGIEDDSGPVDPPGTIGLVGNMWPAEKSRWRVIEWGITPRDDGGAVLVGRDVSDRVRMQSELLDAAQTDPLTGLLNRTAFLEAVNARLADGQTVAVMFIDLDNFKEVNDTMGHAEGDRLLHKAAECLRQAAGPGDAVARLGGDEFAVMPAAADPEAARIAADAVVTAFNGFDETAHGRPSVSASLGLVLADPAVTRTAREVLRDADLAMYRAKQRGGAGVVDFEPWMSERVMEHHRLRGDLETAVRDESLTLYLQPVVDLHTRQWEGFEALVRWPVGAETWSPAQFLPVAEESGLIVPMGAWVLRESLRQLAGWRDERLGMAVNVSAQQLVGTDFFDITMQALTESGIAPSRLTLEITEQAAIQDLGRTASRLELLRSEGVHVAIDDFGTGFSSLQYLSRLPVDILKIDRKFVWGLGQQAEDDVLVRSMLGLAAELGLEVIAEGVETRRQAELLLEYGCRLAQGFLFSPPRPIEELRASDPFVSPAPAPRIPQPRRAVDDRQPSR
ncbi:putative bifunctional diguanylate cyclase/phosphodiesterase [Kineosporia babensis]|uniref:Bifunctional diguanylate cyclase/phosphodiesterase n=1 Tax=Kineosporia babensis TaxID=499548 RepID=A0A9X1NH02_9ACTN|nr:bifunctional diguanylate cyclase/phosphodiesterase [Kineosporia babensis]MCD5313725.1 bifunctional diguanylate cyclase/phosphodiesterase [Kineosporia babensis]